MTDRIKKIVDLLSNASDIYFNTGDSVMSDKDYDILRKELKRLDPANEFLTGVGSKERGGKVKLPYKMGSLTEFDKDSNDIEKWVINNKLNNEVHIVSTKMDGTSILLIYDLNAQLQIAYSRGDGIEGADITRHVIKIPGMLSINRKISTTTTIRAECIISRTNFEKLNEMSKIKGHRIYKNARNAIAGIMNSKTNPTWIYQFIDIITYEIINTNDKIAQLAALSDYGLKVVEYKTYKGYQLDNKILSEAIVFNKTLGPLFDYEQDGVVIDVNSGKIRQSMDKIGGTLDPSYSRKFKIMEVSNLVEAKVLGVEWEPSKNGLIKPTVNIEPVELVGVTINFATGFNAKFIIENDIGEGAIVKLTRAGDVIPHILEVIKPGILRVPEDQDFGHYSWTKTRVDFILTDPHDSEIVQLKSMTSFFEKLNITSLKERSVLKFIKAGFNSIEKIIKATKQEMIGVIGKNGEKAFDSLHYTINNIQEHEFIGAFPIFGGGIGQRSIAKLFDYYGKCSDLSIKEIIAVPGFDFKSAVKIFNGLVEYNVIIQELKGYYTFIKKEIHVGKLTGFGFLFTGYRDKEAESQIELLGGKMVTTINKATHLVAKDINGNSSKLKQARQKNVKILSIDELLDLIEN